MQPEYAGPLKAGDFVYLFSPPEYTTLLDRLFSQNESPDHNDKEYFGQFLVNTDALVVDLLHAYDLQSPKELAPDLTVGTFMMTELGGQPVVGDRVPVGTFDLVVRGVHQGKTITEVGLALHRESRKSAYVRKSQRQVKSLRMRLERLLSRKT